MTLNCCVVLELCLLHLMPSAIFAHDQSTSNPILLHTECCTQAKLKLLLIAAKAALLGCQVLSLLSGVKLAFCIAFGAPGHTSTLDPPHYVQSKHGRISRVQASLLLLCTHAHACSSCTRCNNSFSVGSCSSITTS